MKVSALRDKSAEDLQKLISEKRTELVEKRRSLHAGELQNPRSIKTIRRSIARALTVIAEKSSDVTSEKGDK